MMNTKGKLWSTIAISFLGVLLALFFFANQGGRTREEIVQVYLQALESRSEALIQGLIQRTPATEELVKQKLQELGGHQFDNLQTCYRELKPQLTIATITGSYAASNQERSFSERISLVYERGSFWKFYRGQWYLYLERV